jgi:predicted amidophosphoribosyltransferase
MGLIGNCEECGRLITDANMHLCHQCVEKDHEMFRLVEDYVREHPGCTIVETADATQVPVRRIRRWLRDGWLLPGPLRDAGLTCRSCGAPIEQGEYCPACTGRLLGQIQHAESKKPANAAGHPLAAWERDHRDGGQKGQKDHRDNRGSHAR